MHALEENKAQEVVTLDLTGKSDFADRMIIATGTSARHVSSLADHVVMALKREGMPQVGVEGKEAADWVLVDAGNVVVHLFRSEVRQHYNLEKMWSAHLPEMAKKMERAEPVTA